jgi:hypothetical protein
MSAALVLSDERRGVGVASENGFDVLFAVLMGQTNKPSARFRIAVIPVFELQLLSRFLGAMVSSKKG